MIEHGLCVTATGEAAFPQTDPKQEELASAPVTEPSPADSEQVMTPRADIATSEGGPSTGLSQADGQMDSADLGVLDDSHSETSQMDPGPVDLGSETSRTLQPSTFEHFFFFSSCFQSFCQKTRSSIR